jgi:hypothetical protein
VQDDGECQIRSLVQHNNILNELVLTTAFFLPFSKSITTNGTTRSRGFGCFVILTSCDECMMGMQRETLIID